VGTGTCFIGLHVGHRLRKGKDTAPDYFSSLA
jgi:hypothetical protein